MPSVLIVDDEPALRVLLHSVFSRAGYIVKQAADVNEAIRACANQRFDIILADVVMPMASGYELADWISRNFPATSVLLMSGSSPDCHPQPARAQCSVIAKPFLPDDVLASVEAALARQPAPARHPPDRGSGSAAMFVSNLHW
jgi:CheY-like chemotaxis protein